MHASFVFHYLQASAINLVRDLILSVLLVCSKLIKLRLSANVIYKHHICLLCFGTPFYNQEENEIHSLHYSLFCCCCCCCCCFVCTLDRLHGAELQYRINADFHRAPETSFGNLLMHLYAISLLQLRRITGVAHHY